MERTKGGDGEDVTRREALGVIVGAGSGLALGCGSSSAAKDGGADGATAPGACAVTPEGEIGPFFSDDSDARFNRSNILPNLDGSEAQGGVPLTLTVTVLDSKNACAALPQTQVDIWHCNAAGVYSDEVAESTSTKQWLRGYQMTDAQGQLTFVTVVPGWYPGRATHIHLRVRSSYSAASSPSDGTNTTQLFFDQTLVDALATNVAPYSAQGKNPTTNVVDQVYVAETKGANVISLSGDDTSGYAAALTIVLPIAF
jgi:protocatechuate 3,4-dioxygenase beta subunit